VSDVTLHIVGPEISFNDEQYHGGAAISSIFHRNFTN